MGVGVLPLLLPLPLIHNLETTYTMYRLYAVTIKTMKKNQLEAGSTIIEVLIATVVVGMVMTAVAALMTVSIKNTALLRYRAAATTQAQSGLEIFRRERNLLGWESFFESLDTSVYCLNTMPANSTEFVALPAGECQNTIQLLGNSFEREALVTKIDGASDADDEIRVELVLRWLDGVRSQSVTLTQIFKKIDN